MCKKYFLNTLQISDGRVYRCLSKDETHAVCDGRGHQIPGNKIDDSEVVRHIESFPCYQSHYSRANNPDRKYLHPELNVKQMYNLYVEWCNENGKPPVKEKYYYNVFKSKFNLHFKQPYTDTCKTCDKLQQFIRMEENPVRKNRYEIQKELHLRAAEKARACLKEDKTSADDTCYVMTFDLEKALSFPKLTTSTAYYKRNMYVYNFGCHSFNTKNGHMFMWDETEGGRGVQELATCIVRHLEEYAKNHQRIILYSDCCGGQNRNIKMALTFLKYVNSPHNKTEVIDHKFLEPGHSYLPNDSDFGLIEKKAHLQREISSFHDWVDIVKTAKRKPFQVLVMQHEDFLSTASLENCVTKRKYTIDGRHVNWLNMKWMRFQRGTSFTIKFKETHNNDMNFYSVNLQKGLGRPLNSLADIEQGKLYTTRRQVSEQKKKDMIDLLHFISPSRHAFFKNLPIIGNTRLQQKKHAMIITEDNENVDEPMYDI